jgi:ribonuclease E
VTQDEATGPNAVEAEALPANDSVEPPTEATEAAQAAQAMDAPQAEPEPVEPAYAPPVTAAPSRPRRHRGRVVAPAGPPRAVTPGGEADG